MTALIAQVQRRSPAPIANRVVGRITADIRSRATPDDRRRGESRSAT